MNELSESDHSLTALIEGTHPDVVARNSAVAKQAIRAITMGFREQVNTALLPLLYASDLTIGQIAGRSHQSTDSVRRELELYVDSGIVSLANRPGERDRYSLNGL